MSDTQNARRSDAGEARTLRGRGASLRQCCASLALAAPLLLVGCNTDEAQRAFRSAASQNLEAGVNALLDGIVAGSFAVLELGTEDDSTTTPTTGG